MDPLTLLALHLRTTVPAVRAVDSPDRLVAIRDIKASQSISVSKAKESSRLDRWQRYIDEAAQRFGVPDSWIRAVINAESGGRTVLDGAPITSRVGAMGLMQLMPQTYAAMRLRYGLGSDPYDPRDNILAGAAYLREMYILYGYPGLFAAYNAGPGTFGAYLLKGRALPSETLNYLAAISPNLAGTMPVTASATAVSKPFISRSTTYSAGRTADGTTLFFSLTGPASVSESSQTHALEAPADRVNSRAVFIRNTHGSIVQTGGGLFVSLSHVP